MMGLFSTLYAAFQLATVVFFVYLVLFVKGLNKMVDVLSRRIIDTFNRYTPGDSNRNDSLASISGLKRFTLDQKYRKYKDVTANEENLFAIKEDTTPLIIPQRKYNNGLSCYCTKTSSASICDPQSKTTNLALKNILNYTPAQKNYNLLHKIFNHLSQVYELKKYNYPQVEGIVIKDDRVKIAIDRTAYQQFKDCDDSNDDSLYQEFVQKNKIRASQLLHDMRSKLSDFLLRFTSWVLYKLFPCFLKAVVVHPTHVEMLKEASKSNLPMIFLPLHRSHLDYILMSFILLNNNIRSPLVASGDNLRIPFFGSLLRGLGAFFIKRRIDPIMGRKDHLYKAILHTYMNECLRAGHNIEFFLEGGRTRTGKPCMPKYGILSVIVEAVMDGTIEDALLVPVSINYEKLIDGNFIHEQLGQPKQMETFGTAMKAIWHVLNSNYGTTRVDFNKPFSLRTLIKTFNTNGKIPPTFNKKLKSNPSTTSLYGTDVVSDEHKSIVESISKHVLYDCAHTQAIMSTNAVAFLLLNKFRNGAKVHELVDALAELKRQLIIKDREIGFTGDYLDVINYSVDILGPALVRKEKINNEEIVKPVSMLPNVIELAYYSNSTLNCYSLDSVVAIALCSLDLSSGYVYKDDLVQASLELCDYLQYEFIFCKPCQSLEANIVDVIETLTSIHEIFSVEDTNTNEIRRRTYLDIDDDDDNRLPEKSIKYYLNSKGKEHLLFLRSLLMPLIEGYTVTASFLDSLVGRTLLENELVSNIIESMKKQLKNGSLLYEESVSVDPVKNALKLYQKMDILEVHQEKKIRVYYLKENYDSMDSVKSVYEKVNVYRRVQNFEKEIFDKLQE